MKKDTLTTKYLTIILLVCILLDGILLCGCSDKAWWDNWMVTAPNLFMILGAFYCILMKKNVDADPSKLTWYYVYKGIKLILTIAMAVLYILFVKTSVKPFIIVTAIAYLVALVVETWIYTHYIKHKKEDKQA
ncbi:MAG: hypothetical protein HUK16_03425 [Bacteroidales bacterium]|nr:hypothetical protein [Bacteroidales bacterium]